MKRLILILALFCIIHPATASKYIILGEPTEAYTTFILANPLDNLLATRSNVDDLMELATDGKGEAGALATFMEHNLWETFKVATENTTEDGQVEHITVPMSRDRFFSSNLNKGNGRTFYEVAVFFLTKKQASSGKNRERVVNGMHGNILSLHILKALYASDNLIRATMPDLDYYYAMAGIIYVDQAPNFFTQIDSIDKLYNFWAKEQPDSTAKIARLEAFIAVYQEATQLEENAKNKHLLEKYVGRFSKPCDMAKKRMQAAQQQLTTPKHRSCCEDLAYWIRILWRSDVVAHKTE
jgi:hypothetical protein